MNTLSSELAAGLISMELVVSDETQDKIIRFIEALEKWSRVYNLIGEADTQQILSRHIFDSLSISKYLTGKNILDVGTGAGLPGIPLALLHTEQQFTLIDSNGKKTRFMQQVVYDLAIKNCQIVTNRVESFKPALCFDNIVSRAFASLDKMISVTRHLLCPMGKFFAMKGKIPTEELAALSEVFKIQLHELNVPGINAKRHLIILEGK